MPPSESPPSPARGKGCAELAACLAIALLAGWVFFWTALHPGGFRNLVTRDPQGYYPLQAAGYRAGHLYLALVPHPALTALKDPYDPVANAPYRVHDLSLYRGHYYMYFGATPAVLLFWPVAAMTGRYVTEPAAVALFCTGAVWTGTALLFAVRRRYFSAAPSWALLLGAACLAFATPITTLLEGPQFYQVPISCAIFLQTLMLAAAYRSLQAGRRLGWLSLAGLLLGLSLGARPNYLLGALALLVPAVAWARHRPAGTSFFAAFLRSGAATFLPTFACGLAILAYNHARFASVSEFGMHFQLAGEKFTNLTQVSPAFILPHYRLYLLSPGLWQSYFPFFAPHAGQPYGLLRYTPWAWLAALAFLAAPAASPRRLFALTVAVAAGANLTMLASFFGSTSRYPGDFAQATLLLAAIGALAAGEWSTGVRARRWVPAAAALLATISVLFCGATYFSGFPDRGAFLALARAANAPAYAWQRLHHAEFGGLRLDLRLPEHPPHEAEPLFETGRQPDQRDWLQIEYLGPATARLGFFHAGTGLFSSRAFPIPADRHVVIETRSGSLFPPFSFPAFSAWNRDDYDAARRSLEVKVNGTAVLAMALDCYESSPTDLRIGRFGWFTGGMHQTFSGEVLSVARLPVLPPPKAAPVLSQAGPVELSVLLPSGKAGGADPILLSGQGDHSDMVYCIYDGLNRVKFAFDHWGNGGPQSETVPYDPLIPHTITVLVDSIAGSPQGRLVVLFDRQPLINIQQIFYPTTPDTVLLGYNKFGATGAGHQFTGQILGYREVGMDVIPRVEKSGSYGAVEMSVIFPFSVIGTNEPLVVTGKSGTGDFIYIRYLDPSHVALGFDHWSVGGLVSPPVEVSYGDTHHLAITMGSLFPAGSPGAAARLVRVVLDGKTVLEAHRDTYPTAAEDIEIAKNQIGGSTCGPSFTGRILSLERAPGR